MIKIDVSVFIQIVNFLFLIWVLNRVLYKPIRKILLQRKDKVAELEQNIETSLSKADDKQKSYASSIKEARLNGLKEKEKNLQAAEDEEKKIIDKINKDAQAQLAEVREKIAKDTDDIRSSLLKEVDKFSDAIGQKILGRAV